MQQECRKRAADVSRTCIRGSAADTEHIVEGERRSEKEKARELESHSWADMDAEQEWGHTLNRGGAACDRLIVGWAIEPQSKNDIGNDFVEPSEVRA